MPNNWKKRIPEIVVTVLLGVLGWLAITVYNLNGSVSAMGATLKLMNDTTLPNIQAEIKLINPAINDITRLEGEIKRVEQKCDQRKEEQ